MKFKIKTLALIAALTASGVCYSACHDSKSSDEPTPEPTPDPTPESEWVLVWEDEFNDTVPDSTVWRRTERFHADWAKTQSNDPRCLEMRDGMLVLRGIVNDDLSADPSPYLCGGVMSKDLKGFAPGRIEVRARLHGAKGAWPAIWLLPFDNTQWPHGGEIDIMERLNHDPYAYQTVHSNYTYNLGQDRHPVNTKTSPIRSDDFNVYGVDIHPDSVVFHINGVKTHSYPRIAALEGQGQFPYYRPMYLLLDMQLGGSWVGMVDPDQLPVEMEIDWVRHYVHSSTVEKE